ncbi:hypothetical protein [Serratia nevei]|uniref:hypothetical protein n=1 Tax=Serratia nevei TaxID=2703794 RepID=UPI00285763CA|nr:hypothetical protein [Serratia nevei]MDR8481517.1 hypothetical protein [Serratia nevei]
MTEQLTKSTKAHMYDCYYREQMTTKLNKSLFNLVSFIQVVLGSTVMADVFNGWLLGFLIMILSSYLFVYKPSEYAASAKQQAFEYEKIIHRSSSLSEVDIKTALAELSEHDSDIPGGLIKPAYIRAIVAAGFSDEYVSQQIRTLTLKERLCAFLGGGIPR